MKSWRSISFSIVILVGVIAFSAVMVSRYQQNSTPPSTERSQGTTEQVKAEALAATDKTELPQTEMIPVEPSTAVTSAEKSLPDAQASAYQMACHKLKEMYVSENAAKQAEEKRRYVQAQQAIINKYSAAGMSFSLKQKTTQSFEAKRHDTVMKQLEAQFRKQLSSIRC